MRINNVNNSQQFCAVYKLRANASELEYFETLVAPIYRSSKKKGIRAFVKNVSEMYTLTGKDAYEFDAKYAELVRYNLGNRMGIISKKSADNIRYFSFDKNNFLKSFLGNKDIEQVKDFKGLLDTIF